MTVDSTSQENTVRPTSREYLTRFIEQGRNSIPGTVDISRPNE